MSNYRHSIVARALALVPAEPGPEDPNFIERFRRDRVTRLMRGLRNGIDPVSLLRYKLKHASTFSFRGATVEALDFAVTLRAIEDIWMAGIYDVPGYVPRPGWRVVDIGANVGIFSMLAASRGAKVVCYEPYLPAFEKLRSNTRRWGVECHQRAVSSAAGPSTAILYVHSRRDNRNTTARTGVTEPGQLERTVEVPAIPLSDVLREPCDLLKVDCEGAEFDFLLSAPEALKMARRMIVEIHGSSGDPHEVMEVARAAGFQVQLSEPFPGTDCYMMSALLV